MLKIPSYRGDFYGCALSYSASSEAFPRKDSPPLYQSDAQTNALGHHLNIVELHACADDGSPVPRPRRYFA